MTCSNATRGKRMPPRVEPNARSLYPRKLVLVRPDQHVACAAMRNRPPPMDLINLVCGARSMPNRKVT